MKNQRVILLQLISYASSFSERHLRAEDTCRIITLSLSFHRPICRKYMETRQRNSWEHELRYQTAQERFLSLSTTDLCAGKFLVGYFLCIVGYLAAPPASAHWMPVALNPPQRDPVTAVEMWPNDPREGQGGGHLPSPACKPLPYKLKVPFPHLAAE